MATRDVFPSVSTSDSPPKKQKITNYSSSSTSSSSMLKGEIYHNDFLDVTDIETFLQSVPEENVITDVESWLKGEGIELQFHRKKSLKSSTILEDTYRDLIVSFGVKDQDVKCRLEIEPIARLGVMTCSTKTRPDICVYHKGNPILFIEVVSQTYENTISKCIANTIDLMRVYLAEKEEAQQFYGFVLPRLHEKENKNHVVQIFVQLTPPLCFKAHLMSVPYHELKSKLLTAIENNRTPHTGDLYCAYFLRIPQSFYPYFADTCKMRVTEQLRSRHSVILANEDEVYKYTPSYQGLNNGFFFLHQETKCEHVLFPKGIAHLKATTFFVYERIDRIKMKRDQVTVTFIEDVYSAILEMHKKLNRAHLDVRVDNMGYRRTTKKLVLIDLDRSKENDKPFHRSIYTDSCMYRTPIMAENVTNGQMDFVQMGYMLLWWLGGKDKINYYHDMTHDLISKISVSVQCRKFLESLIFRGECSLQQITELSL